MSLRALVFLAFSSFPLITPQSDQGFNVSKAYMDSICTSADREPQACKKRIWSGCICYNNGTCVDRKVNKCMDCQRDDVFAVIHDQTCPKEHPYLCPPSDSVKRIVPSTVVGEACTCMRTGECAKKSSALSKSIVCMNSNVLAFFPLKDCPAASLNNLNKPVIASNEVVCKESDRNSEIACATVIDKYGCVTYADGSQDYVPVNDCTCQSRQVIKYEVDKECPPKSEVVCKESDREVDVACPPVIDKYGCVTYADGSQDYVPVNDCTCQSREIIKYEIGKQCPSTKVVCTESSRNTEIACAAVVDKFGCVTYADGSQSYVPVDACTCHNRAVIEYDINKKCPPREVVCTEASRNTEIFCAAVIDKYGCVTYANGSKAYVPVNACTCHNREVVKYVEDQVCV